MREPAMFALFGLQATHEGRTAEGRAVLDQLEQWRRNSYVEPLLVLELCATLNDRKQFALWFRRGYEERSTFWVYMPMLWKEYYQSDPELVALVARTR